MNLIDYNNDTLQDENNDEEEQNFNENLKLINSNELNNYFKNGNNKKKAEVNLTNEFQDREDDDEQDMEEQEYEEGEEEFQIINPAFKFGEDFKMTRSDEFMGEDFNAWTINNLLDCSRHIKELLKRLSLLQELYLNRNDNEGEEDEIVNQLDKIIGNIKIFTTELGNSWQQIQTLSSEMESDEFASVVEHNKKIIFNFQQRMTAFNIGFYDIFSKVREAMIGKFDMLFGQTDDRIVDVQKTLENLNNIESCKTIYPEAERKLNHLKQTLDSSRLSFDEQLNKLSHKKNSDMKDVFKFVDEHMKIFENADINSWGNTEDDLLLDFEKWLFEQIRAVYNKSEQTVSQIDSLSAMSKNVRLLKEERGVEHNRNLTKQKTLYNNLIGEIDEDLKKRQKIVDGYEIKLQKARSLEDIIPLAQELEKNKKIDEELVEKNKQKIQDLLQQDFGTVYNWADWKDIDFAVSDDDNRKKIVDRFNAVMQYSQHSAQQNKSKIFLPLKSKTNFTLQSQNDYEMKMYNNYYNNINKQKKLSLINYSYPGYNDYNMQKAHFNNLKLDHHNLNNSKKFSLAKKQLNTKYVNYYNNNYYNNKQNYNYKNLQLKSNINNVSNNINKQKKFSLNYNSPYFNANKNNYSYNHNYNNDNDCMLYKFNNLNKYDQNIPPIYPSSDYKNNIRQLQLKQVNNFYNNNGGFNLKYTSRSRWRTSNGEYGRL